MKHLHIFSIAAAALLALAGCQEKYTTYSGPSYIAFSDTLNVCPVQQDGEAFDVMIASTQACDHDRTFAVEVVDKKSNAVFGHHYTIPSQTVTIPAGERSASVKIIGNYDNVANGDSLSVTLSLVSADDENWDLYGQTTRVLLKKVCPFDIHSFEGHCRILSSFWLYYNTRYLEKIVEVKVAPDDENVLIFKDFLMDGFDIRLRVDNSDILSPTIRFDGDQVIGDTRIPFNYIYGDGRIFVTEPPIDNVIDICEKFAYVYEMLYVNEVGAIGTFVSILQWLTEEEERAYESTLE